MTREQAIALFESGWWKGLPHYDRALFQLFEARLCMPFAEFHLSVQEALGRSVWTHEFAHRERLQSELLGDLPAPTFEQILNLIPADKRILLVCP